MIRQILIFFALSIVAVAQQSPSAQAASSGTPATTPPVASSPAPASPNAENVDSLSDDEVKKAMAGVGDDHWVLIEDMGLMAAQGNQVPHISLYMPESVISTKAASARKQFLAYTPSAEDRRRSLMIAAKGYAGKTLGEGCTSITRIVLLSDEHGSVVKEAYTSEGIKEVWRNSLGITSECQWLRAKFALDDVQAVKHAAAQGEFFVAVFAGSTMTKMYKVKKKHQSKLGLE